MNGFLQQGTYWLDWATAGAPLSGPWAPPIEEDIMAAVHEMTELASGIEE